MSDLDFVRLRGTVVAISTFFAIVSLYMIIDQQPAAPVSSPAVNPRTTLEAPVVSTIPVDNRLCALAQRLMESLPDDEPAIALAMQDFYAEVASFTQGDLRGEFSAASRYYREVNEIAVKAKWDVDAIVRNNDGARWRALLTGTPTGVEESREVVRERCRVHLAPPPFIEVYGRGRISDPRLAKLLEPVDREIHRPPPEPEPSEAPAP